MSDLNKVKEFIENSVKANAEALKLQVSFYEKFTRRQGECLADLADSRLNSLKEMTESGSFDKSIAINGDFENLAKTQLEKLHDENVKSVTSLTDSLKKLYQA